MKECLARVPSEVTVEPLITEGPVSRAVLAVGEALKADLVVMTTHGRRSDEHASLTLQMVEHGERPVLVLHEATVETRTPRFSTPSDAPQPVLAASDLSPESSGAVNFAIDLLRALPIELHLVHLLRNGRQRADAGEDARGQLRALVPEDLRDRVQLHVQKAAHRDPAEDIAEIADHLAAACIVMGEHTRLTAKRWFGRDPSTTVLRQTHCPVWYVPATVASGV
jgi:nucleotide-binding universal stress UspA family protein